MQKNPASPSEQEKNFFVKIFRRLGAYQDPCQSISGILQDTCEFFGFYSGFIYEADHAQVFHLCEQYRGGEGRLAENFSLTDYLDGENLEDLVKRSGEIVYLQSRKTEIGSKFLELFSAQTLVMVPVIFENRFPIAFVGLMDRRKPIRLSKREIDDADAVLSVLAGHIKNRVYQRRLEYVHASMKNIVDNAGLEIYVSDFETNEVLFVNEALAASHGGMEKILGKKCWEAFSPIPGEKCPDCPWQQFIEEHGKPDTVFSRDYRNCRNGNWFRVLHTAFHWVDGRLVHAASGINITENKKNEELIQQMAEHDTLTSLPNRRKFMADINERLNAVKQGGGSGYLFFMDLDDFKKINDTLGHLEGDALLRVIGKFLMEEQAVLGTPYRYGGDEFVIIAADKTQDDLRRSRDLLLERFNTEWRLRDLGARCGISIGAVRFSGEDDCAEELIKRADLAMYEVKKNGKHGFCLSGA